MVLRSYFKVSSINTRAFRSINLLFQATKTGDTRLRLEKALADVVSVRQNVPESCSYHRQYERLAQIPESACDALKAVTKRQKSSYIAWTTYTEVLMYVHSLFLPEFVNIVPIEKIKNMMKHAVSSVTSASNSLIGLKQSGKHGFRSKTFMGASWKLKRVRKRF